MLVLGWLLWKVGNWALACVVEVNRFGSFNIKKSHCKGNTNVKT